ncbi:hypothetical protein J1N35_044765 [Gossypium stocksii]|uniref:Reverse transcriptase domain-containing protein n=1 Tax=Gossypium stocksii TaxID=47602 RepID=A0A9D3U9N5_9ROSI|nr:hypothetical protein J1N35_044765 [Gossypium stocksii]
METKLSKMRMENVRRKCAFLNGIDIGAEGLRGGLCLAWKDTTNIWLKSFSAYHIDVALKENNDRKEWRYDDGRETCNEQELEEIETNYFQNLFSSNDGGDNEHILTRIERFIFEDDKLLLIKNYTKEEVVGALKEMGPTNVSGDNGFPALFFPQFWHIVEDKVTDYCLGVLNRDMSVDQCNFTNIVLIPKVSNPVNLGNFRPISLCNVLYKIVAKIIVNRFKSIIVNYIDGAQSSFAPDRLISDNVLISREIFYALRQKRAGKKGFMAFKLDMSKAYDRVQ